MKLLLDENLSPLLVKSLFDLYPGSAHVHDLGLGASDDSAIWGYAKENGFSIVSKDADFAERSVLESDPPKVVWLRIGNCTTDDVEALLRAQYETICGFVERDSETCLLLLRS